MNSDSGDIPKAEPQRAADAAIELLKQLITLASGALALSATFVSSFRASTLAPVLLPVCWVVLVASVLAALEAISAIVKSRLTPEFPWSKGYGRTMAALSKYCFVGGLATLATVAFAVLVAPARVADGAVVVNNQVQVPPVSLLSGSVGHKPAQQRSCPHDTSRTER